MVSAVMGDADWSIPVGTPVFDVIGEKMGTVSGTDGFDLILEEGFLLIRTHHVPMTFVEKYEAGALHLSLPKADVLKK